MKDNGNCSPLCHHEGKCFAKQLSFTGLEVRCSLLTTSKFGGKRCPFQKEKRDVTNGKRYPFNPHYGVK